MTQDEIIEMAKQAGIKRRTDEFYSEFCDGVYADDFEAFAKLVAQHEREACAKLCDELVSDENTIEYANGAYRCAVHIRERREA